MSDSKLTERILAALDTVTTVHIGDEDMERFVVDLGGHDDRIAAVKALAGVLWSLARKVELDCDQMSYEHGKDGDRYGDNEAALDHYKSKYWYAADGNRMANYCARIEEADERDEAIVASREAVDEAHPDGMTEEQADEAIKAL